MDSKDLLTLIKKAALEAVATTQPANAIFGRVISVNPLKIQIDQKLILTKEQLALSKHVTNYSVSVSVDWDTSESNEHTHDVSGIKSITINNALAVDDRVILLQCAGGQRFIVLDKIGG